MITLLSVYAVQRIRPESCVSCVSQTQFAQILVQRMHDIWDGGSRPKRHCTREPPRDCRAVERSAGKAVPHPPRRRVGAHITCSLPSIFLLLRRFVCVRTLYLGADARRGPAGDDRHPGHDGGRWRKPNGHRLWGVVRGGLEERDVTRGTVWSYCSSYSL